MPDQYQCKHGHRYYDGDQGVGSPYDDGHHDATAQHGYDRGTDDYDPWERDAYAEGYRAGVGVET